MKKQLFIFLLIVAILTCGCADETKMSKVENWEAFDKPSEYTSQAGTTEEVESTAKMTADITAEPTQTEESTATPTTVSEETAKEATICSTDYYCITLPDKWDGKYNVKCTDGKRLIFHHKTSIEEGYEGYLFSICLETDASDYDYHPGHTVLGYLTVADITYHVVVFLPTDIQFNCDDMSSNSSVEYQQMSQDFPAIYNSLTALNGAIFKTSLTSEDEQTTEGSADVANQLIGAWWEKGSPWCSYEFFYNGSCTWQYATDDPGTYSISSDKTLKVKLPWSTTYYKWSKAPIESYKSNKEQDYWCITDEGILILNDTKYYKDNVVIYESNDGPLLPKIVGIWCNQTKHSSKDEYVIYENGAWEHNIITVPSTNVVVHRHLWEHGMLQIIDESTAKLRDDRGLMTYGVLHYDAENDTFYFEDSDESFIRSPY